MKGLDDDRLGRLLDVVDDVIEMARQHVDVLAVERRDKGVLEALLDLVVDLVALVLEHLDPGDALLEPVEGDHAVAQLAGRGQEVLARRHEHVEEPLVARQEAQGDHGSPPFRRALRLSMTIQESAPTMPTAGMVSTQATRIERATPSGRRGVPCLCRHP
jgi:hypothetical protein